MKHHILLVIIVAAVSTTALAGVAPAFERSLVEIVTTYQDTDPFMPWQRKKPGYRNGYGVAIGKRRILAPEWLLRNHKLIEVLRPGKGEKYRATVERMDVQSGLAILNVADGAFKDLLPVEIANAVPRDSELNLIQLDRTGQLQTGKAEIRQVAVDRLPGTPYSALMFNASTRLNANAVGAPLLWKGRLAGIVMRFENGTSDVLPHSVLDRFVKDVDTPPYRGFASAGFAWSPLIDPAKRRYLKVAAPRRGILVLTCLRGTGAEEALKPNDVILAWDGHAIDNQGFYQDAELGKLMFPHLIRGRRLPGDVIKAQIIRDRATITVDVRLSRRQDQNALIPANVSKEAAEYLVEGGLVIRELTGRYLQSYGSDWQRRVDSRLVNLYLTRSSDAERAGDRVVLLAGVLPDPINIGYQRFRNAVITHVNGDAIRNISDVFRIVDRDGHLRKLRLQSIGVDLVLDPKRLQEANSRLSRLYRVPQLRFQRRSH